MAQRRTLWISVSVLLVSSAVAGGWALHTSSVAASSAPPTTGVSAGSPALPGSTGAMIADGKFLAEVTEADPSLASYEKKYGNVALRALLTDGTAFCSFLKSDDDIDDAMVSVVTGAQHVQSTTKLPMSVTTFNAVDAVALLALCPSLETSVPRSDLGKIRKLGASLAP